MLTDEQKEQIRLEEIYREEIRKSLLPKKSGKGRVLSFLNSPLGLWLLSSILLATLTSAWGVWSTKRDQNRLKEERISKIKVELNYRLSQAEQNLDQFSSGEGVLAEAVYPLTRPTYADSIAGPPMLPDFDKRSAKSLLGEWQILSSEAGRPNKELFTVIGNLEKLDRFSKPRLTPEEEAESVKQARALINRAKSLVVR